MCSLVNSPVGGGNKTELDPATNLGFSGERRISNGEVAPVTLFQIDGGARRRAGIISRYSRCSPSDLQNTSQVQGAAFTFKVLHFLFELLEDFVRLGFAIEGGIVTDEALCPDFLP